MQKQSKGSILIVDDDKKVLKSLSAWLKSEGYKTYISSAGSEAEKIIRNKEVDVALVDYRMSNGDGIALTKKLRAIDGDLRTIILTGFPSYESAVLAMKSGVFDYLSKSMPNQKILEVIKNAVKERRQGRIVRGKDTLGKNAIKIILLCDHSLIKERLESFSRANPKFELVKSFAEMDQLKEQRVSREIDIALICAGCCLKTFKDCYEVFPVLYRNFPGVKPVVINEDFTDKEKVELLKLGVRGFSSRDLSSGSLEKALISIKEGEVWVSRRVTNLSLQDMMDYRSIQQSQVEIPDLTGREIEILKTMTLGLRNKEIADRLFISEKTVKTHVNRIFKKLGVNTRTSAILAAIEKKVFANIETEQANQY